jgi:hypothetical protein
MHAESVVVETMPEPHKPRKELQSAAKTSVMKAILIKNGEYQISNTFVLPSLDVCLLGEPDTVFVPGQNVLPVLGVGNDDIKCRECGYILAMKVKRSQIQNLTIKCPSCECSNQL